MYNLLTFLFWNVHTCLIQDNRSTPSLLVFDYSWNSWLHQVSTDVLFWLKMIGSLSADEEISQLSAELESGWSTLVQLKLKT